ncbi:MAG: hypothetical protein ACK5KM_04035 [Hyphomicrobiaceae bacterium]
MAMHLTGTELDMRESQQKEELKTSAGEALTAFGAAFNNAIAASHIYDGLVGFKMPRDEAVRRAFEMVYEKQAPSN